jgi:AcrR family transcriptional regulator
MRKTNKKRDKLLAAIDILFLQKGSDAVTISDVASFAGVPLGNVYYYFKTKNSMLQDALRFRLSQLQENIKEIEIKTRNPKLQLQYFISLFLGIPQKNLPAEIKFMCGNVGDLQGFKEDPPSLGRFITTLLLDLEKNVEEELQSAFSPIVEYVLGWVGSKFLEIGLSLVVAKEKSISFLNMLIGACVFSLNRNVNLSIEDPTMQYIKFIIQSFDLEDKEKINNISFPFLKK